MVLDLAGRVDAERSEKSTESLGDKNDLFSLQPQVLATGRSHGHVEPSKCRRVCRVGSRINVRLRVAYRKPRANVRVRLPLLH